MATPRQFVETLAVPTSVVGLASIPSGNPIPDAAIIRVEGATCRWSETNGSFLTASTGILVSPADAPFMIMNLSAFRITGTANGGVLQAAYYSGFSL